MKKGILLFVSLFALFFVIFTCIGCYLNYGGVYTFDYPWYMFTKDIGFKLIATSLGSVYLWCKIMAMPKETRK